MPAIPDLDSFPVQRQESPGESVTLPADPPQPPEQHTVVDPCLCGHGPEAHEHYRPGSDCGACGRSACGEYRAADSAWRRLLRGVGIGR
ncbi:hypothetical protein [Pseudonocardia zijingensis]|jgi:hypothetical protein